MSELNAHAYMNAMNASMRNARECEAIAEEARIQDDATNHIRMREIAQAEIARVFNNNSDTIDLGE